MKWAIMVFVILGALKMLLVEEYIPENDVSGETNDGESPMSST